jgi:hypothetical protein
MFRRLFATILVVAACGILDQHLSACGDKFLLLGRPTGYRMLLKAPHPAVIVVYSTERLPNAFRDGWFASVMEIAGHRQLTVRDRPALAGILAKGNVDLVLADAAVSQDIAAYVEASSKTLLVPVVADASSAERSGIEKQYGIIFKLSADPRKILNDLDRAMKLRARRARV